MVEKLTLSEAKVRDGRPIKIEGNTLSSIPKVVIIGKGTGISTDSGDTGRLKHPLANSTAVLTKAWTWLLKAWLLQAVLL